MHPREKPGVENERGSSLEIEEDTPWDTRFPLRELALCPARARDFTLQLQQHLHTVQCLMFMVRIQVLLNDWNTN